MRAVAHTRRILQASGIALVLAFACVFVPCAGAATDPAKVLHVASPDIEALDPEQYSDNPCELTAGDYVFSLKRWLDPNLHRGGDAAITRLVVGAQAIVDAAKKPGAHFDYAAPMAGLRALDRYTLQLKLTDAVYPPVEFFLTLGACAHEVVAAAGRDIGSHPVGTGPYMLKEWKRGSRVTLVANPGYRELRFPADSDGKYVALATQMANRTLPRIGEIDIDIIEEESVRVLEFERGNLDYITLHRSVANRLLTRGALRDDLARRGVVHYATAEPFIFFVYFNMDDPAVGGMGKEGIALRRAMMLGFDARAAVDVLSGGQALPASQLVAPNIVGHDSGFGDKTAYDPYAANALLDRLGFARGNDSGYRNRPDGAPLVVSMSLRTGGPSSELATLMRRNFDAIGIHVEFRMAPFQDLIKEVEHGRFTAYYGGYGGLPFAYGILQQLDSRAPRVQNVSHFSFPAYDRAMDAMFHTDDPARQTLEALKMAAIARAYVPMFPVMYRLQNEFAQPWLQGFAPLRFATYWQYLDIDMLRKSRGR